jgi:urea transport system substrate-binding protein
MKTRSLFTIIKIAFVFIPSLIGGLLFFRAFKYQPKTIKVGILHSTTGQMAKKEGPIIDAILFAINDFNKKGGLLGKKLEPIIFDGQSNPEMFAKGAKSLINNNNVEVIFGCFTSADRKMVKPIVEKYNKLLFYSLQYEGLEESKNIIYVGATPNQQIIPGIAWCLKNLGKKIFLVGSDSLYPQVSKDLIKNYIKSMNGEVIGEYFFTQKRNENVQNAVQAIKTGKPDVIILINNIANIVEFFKELRASGIHSKETPTMSFGISEDDFSSIGIDLIAKDYMARGYFQSIQSEENKDFIKNMKSKYGINKIIGDPSEASYSSVLLWAQGVEKAKSTETNRVKQGMKGASIRTPEGPLFTHENLNTWRVIRVGQISIDGKVTIVWSSKCPLPPVDWPSYKSKEGWKQFLKSFYVKWNNHWYNPNQK